MSADVAVAVPTPGPAVEVNGLHSPPDSNMKDASDSELSELDDEHNEPPSIEKEADIEEIEPDYFSDGGVPVFVPTMDQFHDFTLFMKKINKYGMSCGIVKVIPPEEWKATQPRLDDAVKTIRVKEPIKQDIMGTSGTYRQANILHQRSYNLPQWRQLCEQSDHQPPAKRGERRVNQDKPTRSTPRTKTPTNAAQSRGTSSRRGRGRPLRGKARGVTVDTEDGGQSTPDRLPTPVSPSVKPEEERADSVKAEPEEDNEPVDDKPRLGSRQAKATVSVSSRRKNNRRDRDGKVDEAAFKDFKYELDGDEYTPERCAELERAYWKTLTYAPPLYGADMPGTLFDERTKAWNLGKLDNILDVMGSKIPGVNTAYLYLGMWKATFAWHLEDVDLYSINYLHFGAPKQWYSIAQGDARRFEAAMKTIWPTDAKACDQFLRHKTFLISPSYLAQNFNIKVNKIVHKPGEFVITFPYGYHSGYNLGYNCAEAVNFGLESWLEYGRVAKKCDCDQAQDSVWINVHELERKLRGEETEYEETDEEEDDEEDEDNENETSALVASTSGGLKTKAPSKKRKRPVNVKGVDSSSKRIRVRIKAPAKEPCVLCPNDIPSEPLLPTEDGNQAHKICAQYIPETDIDGDKVIDIKYIAKGRLELKCNYCRSKKGACFQCSRKKCTRAYHATCAAAAGVFVEQGEIPVFGEDGTEYKEWGIEFSCRFHRIKRDKKLDSDALADSERAHKAGANLSVGEVCQVQYYRGDIFAGAVVENRKDEEMVLLDILPRGDRVEVEYKWLLVPDPADYHLVKPSANAIPMPKSRKDKESLNTTKRMADDLPRAEDPFVEGHTWAEFNHEKIPVNPFQVKIDFQKENQTWFYLGKTSTEARAQYTEDPRTKRHNPKGNFLDTIPKLVAPLPRVSYAASYPTGAKNQSPTPIRPPKQALPNNTASAVRHVKPYVYKPRAPEETYRVDPQAYRSQQNFLQRATPQPYAFGTDPQYKSTDSAPSRPYAGQAAVGNVTPSPQVAMALPAQYGATQSPTTQQSQFTPSQRTTPTQYTPSQFTPSAQYAVPNQYRPPHPSAPPPKPNNPFGVRPQTSRPTNVFAKYPYLQKEHNRSPLEYKTPYRPGGGFMNGYQGSLEKHLQQTMFAKRPSITSSVPGPAMAAYNNMRYGSSIAPSYTSSTQSPGYSSYGASSGSSYITPSATNPITVTPTNTAPVKTWGQKDTTQLHPAIRQEYHNSILQHSYNAPPGLTAPQPRSNVLQPPSLHQRPQFQPSSNVKQSQAPQQRLHNQPAPTQQHAAPPANHNRSQSLSASHPQQYRKPNAEQLSRPQQTPTASYSPTSSIPHQAISNSHPPSNSVTPQHATVGGYASETPAPQPAPPASSQFESAPTQSDSFEGSRPTSVSQTRAATPTAITPQVNKTPGDHELTPAPSQDSQRPILPPTYIQAGVPKTTTPQASQRPANAAPPVPLKRDPTPILPPPPKYQLPSKNMYPYQQNFQNPKDAMQSYQQNPNCQKFEPADVPPDSYSIVEQMINNLKKF